VAKRELLNPSCRPMATASAVTVAECEDGIPPDPTSCLASHRFSLYLQARRGSRHGELRSSRRRERGREGERGRTMW
jgi:hypothetical protein